MKFISKTLSCETLSLCVTFNQFKKIRHTDQIKLVANCQIGCSNQATFIFTYQIYKLENQLSWGNVTWIAVNQTESYISGII